jgi:hypothetical protein
VDAFVGVGQWHRASTEGRVEGECQQPVVTRPVGCLRSVGSSMSARPPYREISMRDQYERSV